jgi:hypothetical protein
MKRKGDGTKRYTLNLHTKLDASDPFRAPAITFWNRAPNIL